MFRIANIDRYQQRFEYFNDMYSAFYNGVGLAYPVDPEQP